jgi:hypothetical protein
MTYLFNSNSSATISNEVEIKNDVGNAIPIVGNINATVYNSTGKVTSQNPLPVTLGGANIQIFGNTNIVDTVTVSSSPENPVHVHLTEIGTSGNIQTNYMPIGGNITVLNPTSSNITIMKNGLPVSDTVGLPIRVINDESLISYARGKAVTEADVLNAYLIDKSGATETLGTSANTMSTVWGGTGLYPWATFTGSGAKIYIKSVTNDPKVQGKSVTIEGLDSNYDILIETVSLHATDTTIPVNTVNNFYRTNKMYLTGANTNNLPHDYNIELRYGSSSGTLIGQMNTPWGRGQNCFYTVPRGYEGFVLSINGNSGKQDEITSSLWFHPFGGTWTLQKSFKFISGMFDHNFRTPLRITEKSDVEIRAYALVESSRIGTEFQMLVLPKA